jgi:two-component system LytT family response regulator
VKGIRALVVDDEPLARLRLRQLLEDAGDVEIIECANGVEALKAARRNPPDVMFLDVRMPAMDGFSLLDCMHRERPPVVVFVTAYDRYALRAFEKCALDYLLKPFDDARFSMTMARIRERLASGSPRAQQLFFAVGQRSGTRIVPAADVDWVGAAGNYVELHVGSEVILHRESLRAIESRMRGTMLRVHRGALVNAEKVRLIEWVAHGDGKATLKDGRSIRVSRRYGALLKARISAARGTGGPA